MIGRGSLLFGQVGLPGVCGRMTGWRFLIIPSLMPTHPVTPRHSSWEATSNRAANTKKKYRQASEGRSHHWFVPRMGCYIANTPAIRSDLLVASPSSQVGQAIFNHHGLGASSQPIICSDRCSRPPAVMEDHEIRRIRYRQSTTTTRPRSRSDGEAERPCYA